MPKITEILEKQKGKRLRLVFEYDRWDRTADGARFSREEFSHDGVLREVFEDGWIRLDNNLVNLGFVKEIRAEG